MVNSGDTAWVMLSAALVLLMTVPGLAFFYGGLVRRKNVLSILMQCFFIACLISLQWVLYGYSLAFGPDCWGLLGDWSWFGLSGVTGEVFASYAATIPHQAFVVFQMMFAIITPALIIGAFAERMKFSAFAVFVILWSTLVYDPVAHWVWGLGGILSRLDVAGNLRPGAADFAGGTVVHINAGVAALVCALFLGRRQGYPHKMSPPHNLPFSLLGAGLLWFGWFGFNAGSALAANGLAVSAFLMTNTASAAAGLSWAVLDWLLNKRPTVLGIITGAVGGLVAVTPAAGFVNIFGAVAIGMGASAICYCFVSYLKPRLGYDDTLDAFGVHGVGGIWGALATGLFADGRINGVNGLFYGDPWQLWWQIKAVVVTVLYSLVMTYVILKLVDWLLGVRAAPESERIGLDLTDHRETGYTMLD